MRFLLELLRLLVTLKILSFRSFWSVKGFHYEFGLIASSSCFIYTKVVQKIRQRQGYD